jgi:hypothetical protein
MNIDEAVVVRTYESEIAAGIAASRLESEGIEAHIHKDDCGGAYPSLQMAGGVRLFVKPEDLEDAKRILDEMDTEVSVEGERAEPEEDRKRSRLGVFLVIGSFLLGLALGYLLSPELRLRSNYTGVIKHDRNAAGTPGIYYYYVDGQFTRLEEDRNYDGKPDAWYKFVAGKISTSAYDDNFKGQPNRWATYKDRFNYVEKVDTDFDGKVDVTIHYVNDLEHRRDWHPGDSAIIERRDIYEYGILKEVLRDTDRDGVFDSKTTYDRFERPKETTKCWVRP